MSVELEVVEDPARACAAMMVGAAAGGGHIVLTGGSTPRTAYEEFVRAVREVSVDLSDTHFWFGDERCVAPEDERSNFRLAREALLDPLGSAGSPDGRRAGSRDGAEPTRPTARGGEPAFDLLLLGMGPGRSRRVVVSRPGHDRCPRPTRGRGAAGRARAVRARISFTFTAIGRARRVAFLVSGEGKADAVAAAFGAGQAAAIARPGVDRADCRRSGDRAARFGRRGEL